MARSSNRHGSAPFIFVSAFALLLASRAIAQPSIILDLRFAPPEDENTVNPITQHFSQTPALPISLRFTMEKTSAAGADHIGEAGPQRPRVLIYAGRPVTTFLEEGATTQLKLWGLTVSNDAPLVLQGEVRKFFLTEGYTFHAEITMTYSVRNRDGKVLWQGDVRSEAKSFGVARKAQNYLEAASEALRENLRSLIAQAGFRDACSAKSGRQNEGTHTTPGELKEAVLRLMTNGLEQELLVAFVRQARISPPFSESDVLEWNAAKIQQRVITAALETARVSGTP